MEKPNTRPYHMPANAVWFITGCSSGIGLAMAKLIASKPELRLVATARNLSNLSTIADKPDVLKLAVDVTKQESVDAAMKTVLQRWGRLDVVLNNAGYVLFKDTEAVTEEEKRCQLETLFWGTERVTVHAMRIMREENAKAGPQGGLIMNLTSMGGFVAFPGDAYYHASKFAVEGFTESVSKEVHPDWNIHFTLLEPGGVNTEFHKSRRVLGDPHPAYVDAPARMMLQFIDSPELQSGWAEADDIAESILNIASRGQRVPLRIPLGEDSLAYAKNEVQELATEFDDIQELCRVPYSKN
ncbi:short-chain dehydrogenase [Trichoderma chlorosporum]